MKAVKTAGAAPAVVESREDVQKRLVKRALLILLAVVIVAAAAGVAYFLMHFHFYNGYRELIRSAYTVEEGSAFSPIEDSDPQVPGMALVAENELLKLYASQKTGDVAIYDKRNGQIVRSVPEDAASDTVANKTNRNYSQSQLIVDYFNASRNTGTYDSFSMSVDRGQMTAESIENGVRFNYGIGEIVQVEYYVPNYLSTEWYDKVQSSVSEADAKTVARMYTAPSDEGGLYTIIPTARNNRASKGKIDAVLQQVNFSEEDYYEMMELGGEEQAQSLFFNVSLEIRLDGDSVVASIPVSKIEEFGGGKIYRLQLMRLFGAAGADESGYLVVPNGSGALINFNNGKVTSPAYSQYVYGMDPVDAEYTTTQNTSTVRLPFYGICREDSSLLVTVERGATLSYISADIAGRLNNYNYAYPSFVVRGSASLSMFGVDGMEADVPVIETNMYDEALSVRYTLLTEENKGYSGLANYYRQKLMDSGVLEQKAESGSIPFYYDVIGGVKETAHLLGFQFLQVQPMTTFGEAGQIAYLLAQDGVENQVMNLQGWFNGGYYHDAANRIKVLRKLGGRNGLENLNGRLSALGGTLYVDVAFQKVSYIAKHFSDSQESSRYFGAGYTAMLAQVNPTTLRRTASLGYRETISSLISPKFLPRYVKGFASSVANLDVTGISLRDLGDELHADKRRTNIISREQALDVVEAQFQTLEATGKDMLVSAANDYAFGYASHIINAPMTATEYFIIDQQIPLYQMILHGCVDYAGGALNVSTSDDWERERLRMIEYGASCHYLFTWQDATEMKYTGRNRDYATKFDNWREEAVAVYKQLNEALAPVSGALMIGHEVLDSGVVKVSYDNGVILYINYAAEDAQADGITVPAMNYAMGGDRT